MRIAIPVTDGQIANHLGFCRSFLIADVEGDKILREGVAENPGHGPGGPPPIFLVNQGVNQVVAWGMPAHARGLFEQYGIRVQLGATGDPAKALRDFLGGTLALTAERLDGGGGCAG
ncbi:MAG: dinitrogenase iron-molybdenum cofactor [Planctomycetes bacterium]|nr:dinitrogenase iron-molybdenum cofactor [Planctomycetota bacterium]